MARKKIGPELDRLTQTQRERLAYIEVKAFYCGDLTRADIECRFGVKPAASARDLIAYRKFAPDNLVYDAGQRCYRATDAFRPLFEQSADRILTWFRSGMGDGLDIKVRRSVPCESASDLMFPDLEILATITRAIASRQLIRVSYLSLASGSSTKTLAPLALADTGSRWHVRAYDCEKKRFADFVLTRVAKARPLNEDIPDDQKIEADVQWSRIVHLELAPHPGVAHAEAIEADYGMVDGLLQFDLRAPLVGYALRRWAVDCSPNHRLDPKSHHLWLKNRQTLYGVESAALAPGYEDVGGADGNL